MLGLIESTQSTSGRSSSCSALWKLCQYCRFIKGSDPKHTLSNTLVEVLVIELCSAFPQCDHSSLDTNSLQLGTIELVCTPCQFIEVDASPHSHLPTMYP